MLVSSVNVQNRYKQANYSGLDNGININELFKNYIINKQIDIAGTQELVPNCIKALKQLLPDYQIVGDTRFQGLSSRLMKRSNESNSIITREKVLSTETRKLPWLPSTLPRIATIAILDTKSIERICFINTHLDFLINNVKYKQLKELRKIILEYKEKYPVIITGDFNLDLENGRFTEYIKLLETEGILRAPIFNKTYINQDNDSPIDHIFVSNDLCIDSCEIVKEEEYKFSDHYPVLCKISRK